MKELFSYNLPYTVKERVTKAQEDGSEITTLENVEKKIRVIIKSQSREDVNQSTKIYKKEWCECVRDGILTRAVLDKQYRNSDGIFTESEQKELVSIGEEIESIKKEYKLIGEKYKENEDKSDEDTKKIEELVVKFNNLQGQLNKLQDLEDSLYQNTAEAIASQKQLAYNTLFLTLVEKDGKIEPYLRGDTLDQKLKSYDAIMEDTDTDDKKEKARLYATILDRNTQYINWLTRGLVTVDQLKEINDSLDKPKDPHFHADFSEPKEKQLE